MPSRSPPASPSVADELTPEKLAEELRKLRIEDLVLSTVSTLGQLAYTKIEAKEFDQARLAIDATAALLPTLEGHVDADVLRDFKQLLANVRLAYANAVAASGSEPQATGSGAETSAADGESASNSDETVPEASQETVSGSEPQTSSEEAS
jgi:hypothetical protein